MSLSSSFVVRTDGRKGWAAHALWAGSIGSARRLRMSSASGSGSLERSVVSPTTCSCPATRRAESTARSSASQRPLTSSGYRAGNLAHDAGLLPEFHELFDVRNDLEGTAKLESILALLLSMTGWVEGQVETMTLEARIQADAEALAKERTKQVGFQSG